MNRVKRVYYARAVDALDWAAVERDAHDFASKAREYSFDVIDPVLEIGPAASVMVPGQLVRHDLARLAEADVLLCDMSIPDRNYIGCCFELSYAYAWHIPSVVVVGSTSYGSRPWLIYHSESMALTQDEGLHLLARYMYHSE